MTRLWHIEATADRSYMTQWQVHSSNQLLEWYLVVASAHASIIVQTPCFFEAVNDCFHLTDINYSWNASKPHFCFRFFLYWNSWGFGRMPQAWVSTSRGACVNLFRSSLNLFWSHIVSLPFERSLKAVAAMHSDSSTQLWSFKLAVGQPVLLLSQQNFSAIPKSSVPTSLSSGPNQITNIRIKWPTSAKFLFKTS